MLAVAGVLAVGILYGSDDPPEEPASAAETTTSRPERTTTTRPRGSTSSTPAQPGPVLGRITGGSIVVLANVGRWTWIDLDSGSRGEMDVRGVGDPSGAVPVAGGLVVAEQSGQATLRPVPDGEALPLGPAEQVLPSGLPDRVWLLRYLTDADAMSARLVDLGGNELLAMEMPPLGGGGWGGTATGLPFSAGGRTFFADGGGVRPVTQGDLLGAVGAGLVVATCDDEARCELELVDLETSRAVRLGEPTVVTQGHVVIPPVGPSGEFAVLSYRNGVSLAWFSSDGRRLGLADLPLLSRQDLAWLPGDLGLLIPTGRGLQRAQLDGRGGITLDLIPGLSASSSEVVYLVNP